MEQEKIIRSQFYDVSIPERINVWDFLSTRFEKFRDKNALVCSKSGKKLTYDQIIKNVDQMKNSLKRFDVKENEVVGMCLQSSVEYVPIMLALNSFGACCSTANPAYTVDELEYNFSLAQIRYVVVDEESKTKVLKVCKKYTGIKKIFLSTWMDGNIKLIETNNFASAAASSSVMEQITKLKVRFLFGSSGTTGPSKAVMLTNKNIVAFLSSYSPNYFVDGRTQMFTFKKSDTLLSVFPHFHIGGSVISLMAALKEGATCVVLPTYSTNDFMNCIETHRPTVIMAPPPVYVFLTKSPTAANFKIPSLQNAIIAGAPTGRELVEEVCQKFSLPYLNEAYGMTEMNLSHIMPVSEKSKRKLGSCGVVFPNGLCKVVDIQDGHALGPNQRGEICYKGVQIMAGYLNNEKATNETIDANGWLHSGDIGYYDEDNYFYIVDRIKELIKVKGFQVAPAELEDLLLSYLGIQDAAVVGLKDPYAGELPRAYIVKNPSFRLTEEDVKNFVASKVVSYKRLEGGVKFVDEIPKGPSGKILRRLLRDQAQSEKSVQSKL